MAELIAGMFIGAAIVLLGQEWWPWFAELPDRWRMHRLWRRNRRNSRRGPAGPPPPQHVNCRCRVKVLKVGNDG